MSQTADENALQAALRALPSVDHVLKQPAVTNLLDEFPRAELLQAVRETLEEERSAIRAGHPPPSDGPSLALAVRQKLHERALPSLRRVVNATGIVLHTGLGRAPLAPEAIEAIAEVAAGYSTLELELETGRRGNRYVHPQSLLRELTGAEDALVVNNNAAGTYLALSTLAKGRGVVVSRGQLVEIGGSYRMPDIMLAAGCKMVEVGTTNRTHVADYELAIDETTSVLLRVHTSNYRLQGFVTSPTLGEMAELARQHNLLLIDDLGSGLLDRNWPWPSAAEQSDGASGATTGLKPPTQWDEPTVRDSVAAGADLTLFSGDKLLGGPQAGVIVGRADLIARLRKNPLARTFRVDKMTLAGMEATLRLYRDPDSLHRRLPIYRMLATTPGTLQEMARTIAQEIARHLPQATARCAADQSYAGGGSLPTIPFPTWVVCVQHPELPADQLAAALRQRQAPIICRVHDEALVVDCRTLSSEDADLIPAALAEVARELGMHSE
jgi:L-seryl-tRNA(Ser) seleniumtransferase